MEGSTTSSRLGYVPALDGLRGVAIAAVVANHFYGLPGGGPLGVGLFFVLSGFLITTLLLEERSESGRVDLRAFYARRARRLLPALGLLLCAYLASQAAKGENALGVVALGGLYVGNLVQAFSWHDVVSGTALGHLWSLAQEEQFYLVWPLVVLLLARSRRTLLWLCLLCVGLVGYRVALTLDGADVLRLYYAPDTHSDWLVAGAALAAARRRGVAVTEPVALVGFAVCFVGLLLNPWTRGWELWQSPILVLGCTALVASACARTQMALLLAGRPVVALGKISYSLYLWHIPVFGALGYRHPAIAAAAAVGVATASYFFVEQPFRRRRARVAPATTAAPSAGY